MSKTSLLIADVLTYVYPLVHRCICAPASILIVLIHRKCAGPKGRIVLSVLLEAQRRSEVGEAIEQLEARKLLVKSTMSEQPRTCRRDVASPRRRQCRHACSEGACVHQVSKWGNPVSGALAGANRRERRRSRQSRRVCSTGAWVYGPDASREGHRWCFNAWSGEGQTRRGKEPEPSLDTDGGVTHELEG